MSWPELSWAELNGLAWLGLTWPGMRTAALFVAAAGVLSLWNQNFLDMPCRAVLPYSQALSRFPAHIQQVDMESNGKRVSAAGVPLPYPSGEFVFGEPVRNANMWPADSGGLYKIACA